MSGQHIAASGPVVVGAGPVGLAAALALRAKGLPALVIEAESEKRVRPGSRGIFVHGESLRLLDSFLPGLGRAIDTAGLVWLTRRTTFRGKDVYARTYYPLPPGRLPPSTSLPQVETERILLAACHQAGVHFRWDARVGGVKTVGNEVMLTLASGERIRAPYVIAADGAHSTIRSELGIALDGTRSESPFVIVDVAEVPDRPMARERVFHYEHPALDGRNLLLVPFAGGWRADLQCREDDDAEALSSQEGVREWLGRAIDPRYADRVIWVSVYRFLQVIARQFTDPSCRVLLVGEAAHLFSPFGARGMNSGFADAASAAAAIRTAIDNAGRPAAQTAIEHFARDRRDAAEYNRAAARSALAHMQAKEFSIRIRRRIAVALAPRIERAGRWLDSAPYGPRIGRPGQQGKY